MARVSRGELIRLQKLHGSDDAIAELFGISRQAVYQWRMRCGIPSRLQDIRKRNREIARLYREGRPVDRIAARYKLAEHSVYRIVQQVREEGRKKRRARKKK